MRVKAISESLVRAVRPNVRGRCGQMRAQRVDCETFLNVRCTLYVTRARRRVRVMRAPAHACATSHWPSTSHKPHRAAGLRDLASSHACPHESLVRAHECSRAGKLFFSSIEKKKVVVVVNGSDPPAALVRVAATAHPGGVRCLHPGIRSSMRAKAPVSVSARDKHSQRAGRGARQTRLRRSARRVREIRAGAL
jgi:hypothetical protein